MKRLTSNNYHEMDMVQLALNQVYNKDGWTWYRSGPDDELSVCDLIRSVAETLGVELPILSDEELSDLLTDFLQYGAKEPEGVLAILYRALWAMATVRGRLFGYEETGLGPDDVTDLMAAHGVAIEKLAEYRMREEKKAPKCYSPDTDGGCRYLVPDGDDEPIDKCKRCPLCYVDKRRHRLSPNTPLTPGELREMTEMPVWIEQGNGAGFYDVIRYTTRDGICTYRCGFIPFETGLINWVAYRRKPEEGTSA